MYPQRFSSIRFMQKVEHRSQLLLLSMVSLLWFAAPATAHHAMGKRLPLNFWEGFLSGLAHPLIGIDHFAFIVAVGLIATIKPQGSLILASFMLCTMLGTGLHISDMDLPGAELLVSGSVLLFGLLLVRKNRPHSFWIGSLAAVAGLVHGYAYGEAIFGAKMTPLLAYLLGFTLIQLAIALSVSVIYQMLFQRVVTSMIATYVRSAGLVLCGVGVAFFVSQLIATVLPTNG